MLESKIKFKDFYLSTSEKLNLKSIPFLSALWRTAPTQLSFIEKQKLERC